MTLTGIGRIAHQLQARAAQVLLTAQQLGVLVRSGVIQPGRPDRIARQVRALTLLGPTLAGTYAAAAARAPHRLALIDERRQLTYAELDDRVSRIAAGLVARGIGEGTPVAIFGRNSASFVEALVAVSRSGADALMLNTFLSPHQVAEVLRREQPLAVIVDEDLLPALADVPGSCRVIVGEPAGRDQQPGGGSLPALPAISLEDLAAGHERLPLRAAARGRIVVLTSGTTGTPKGARRPSPKGLGPAAAMFSRIRMAAGGTTMIASPLFHTWGLGMLQLTPAQCRTLVLRRRPTPEAILDAVQAHRCDALVVVPVMLQRLLDLEPAQRARYDTSALTVVAASGSALTAHLGTRFQDAFGDVLHNIYGSTEVSWAAIADPADLRAAPGTAGRPPLGTVVEILDEEGLPLPAGEVGRIFVGNEMMFEGYTSGAGKERARGLMSTGDLGRMDGGLVTVLGRDDDMIISGGENVFPSSVEELLGGHEAVREVAVTGVPDDHLGQRLACYLVLKEGSDFDADAVRAYVKQHVAVFAVPRDVVYLDALPRNPTGKVVPRLLPPST